MSNNGANNIPERLVNFRIYNEAEDLLGVSDIELPELAYMSDTISGAGMAGEVESPVIGHFQSMGTTLNWRTIEKKAIGLLSMKAHLITARGAQQSYDAANGTWKTVPVRCTMRVMPKKLGTGKFEVIYMKLYIDNKDVLEIDKYNYKCVINGEDILSPVRVAMGLSV